MLDEIGVDQIEAGIPAMGGIERELVEEIAHMGLRASICGWSRAVPVDIRQTLDCGVDAIAISLPTSDIHLQAKLGKSRAWVLETIKRCVALAKETGVYVSVGAEDASRTDLSFLCEYAKAAASEGANRLRFCDTVGIMDPFRMYSAIRALRSQTDLELEVHTHNDFGMAVANTLAGLHAGAAWANTTIGGLGERAGNAPLEELVMALRHIEGMTMSQDTRRFTEIVEYVMAASSREVSSAKPIVGRGVFAHEAGIHADGVIKNPATYEVFAPGEVGATRSIVVGKHSGRHTLKLKFDGFGSPITDEEAGRLLPFVRNRAIKLKRSLSDEELRNLHNGIFL